MIDTARSIETPEGVELTLRVAGPVVRAMAWSIDTVIKTLIYLVLSFTLPRLADFGIGLLLISFFVVNWFYPVFFEIYRQGATPGKRRMKIKVLHELGTPVNASESMIRNLLRTIDFLPLFYGFGFITMLLNQDFKRIGDLAAGTVVVYEDEQHQTIPLPDESPRPLPCVLTLEEQRVLIHFAERAQTLTPERLEELANIVTPLTQKTGTEGIRTLYQIAHGLIR
jgi:uncharacterized RDD family membrane protein YckC